MSHYPSEPDSGNRRNSLIVFVIVLLMLGCIGAGATGAILLFGGGYASPRANKLSQSSTHVPASHRPAATFTQSYL